MKFSAPSLPGIICGL